VDYRLDFSWVSDAARLIANGAVTTIFLTIVSAAVGTIVSIVGAAWRRSGHRALERLVATYVELIRNTPFLVQLFFIYFGLPSLGIRFDPLIAAMTAMTVNFAAYGIEIVGAGIDAVAKGQREAGSALGLRAYQIFVKIVLPQAMKVILPSLTSQIVITMLESAAVSQIAVRDLTYEADLLQARTFRAFETYLVVTAVYLGMSVGLRRLTSVADQWFLSAEGR
jgi:polar amino acid transport system permease protein